MRSIENETFFLNACNNFTDFQVLQLSSEKITSLCEYANLFGTNLHQKFKPQRQY